MSEIFRLIGGGLVALVMAYIGVLVKKRYKLRETFFQDARDYFVFFERELTFKKTPLPEINTNFANAHNRDFANMFLNKTKNDALFLKKEEKTELEEAMRGLGKSAYQEQLNYVKRWKAEFEDMAGKCAHENKKYGGMYFKLCVLLGIALLILIA